MKEHYSFKIYWNKNRLWWIDANFISFTFFVPALLHEGQAFQALLVSQVAKLKNNFSLLVLSYAYPGILPSVTVFSSYLASRLCFSYAAEINKASQSDKSANEVTIFLLSNATNSDLTFSVAESTMQIHEWEKQINRPIRWKIRYLFLFLVFQGIYVNVFLKLKKWFSVRINMLIM